MAYTDYTFYKNSYHGTMPDTVFNRLVIKASTFIKRHTFDRIDLNNIPEDVKNCTCEVADKMLKIEQREGKTSESVGNWRIDYVDNSEDKQELYNILVDYLSELVDVNGTLLLYRGC
jgi:predicted RNA methylase